MSITCRVLGPIEIRVHDADPPADLLWKKNVALLLYLAFSPGRTRTREQIIGMLWAEKSDSAARQSAREAIRTLRRHLGADAIETRADAVQLHGADLHLDTDHFTALAEAGDWPAAAQCARGGFAEGFAVPDCVAFDGWLSAERMTWNRRVVEALVRAAGIALDAADLSGALDLADRALHLDPGAEDAVAVAMRADAISGHRAPALKRFDEVTDYLSGLHTKPSQELSALADRIRSERTWRRPQAPPTGPGEPRDASLVGRRAAIATCLDRWAACRSQPRAGVLLIEADPGHGKTRLAEEVLHRARLDGAATVTLRCVSGDRDHDGSGLHGLVHSELVRVPGVGSAPPEALGALAAAAPEWGDVFPKVSRSSEWPLDRAVRAAVEGAVAEQPVALLLDDAQWLDDTSRHLVLTLLRDLASRPLLVIMTTTSGADGLDQLRVHLGQDVAGAAVRLGPLDLEHVRVLVNERFPDTPEDQCERIARRLAADSGGIALLVVELLRAVAAGMELADPQPGWPLANRTLDQTLPSELPTSVSGAIRVRFRAVSPLAQEILRVLAVGEERLTADLVQRVTNQDTAAVDEALDELEWERLIQCDRRGYAFVARIVREVIRQDMLTGGQRQRIRSALEGGAGTPPS